MGVGGIATGEDAVEFLLAGAWAVQVGTALLVDPSAHVRIARELHGYLRAKGFASPGGRPGQAPGPRFRPDATHVIPRPENPLVVALDVSDLETAEALAGRLAGHVGLLKVGLELFAAHGSGRRCRASGRSRPVFLDLKLHDIPTTVEGAARNGAAARRGDDHRARARGRGMIAAAVRGAAQGAERCRHRPPSIVAVTVLSSLAGEDLASPASLAFEAKAAGARGVVVSGEDVSQVREVLGEESSLVVPGIRPAGIERTRPGSRPDSGGGDRTRRRLPRGRSSDHRVERSRRRRARDPRVRSLSGSIAAKPQVASMNVALLPARGRAYTPRRPGPRSMKECSHAATRPDG